MKLPSAQQRLDARAVPSSPVVMHQDWANLLFLHWEFPADSIQSRLPEGLYVDTFEGQAYMGIVPFFMKKVRPSYLPSLPGISWFQELNLRTYVFDKHGNPGVWFFTLDCNQWLAVKIARALFSLPYNHASMQYQRDSNQLVYTSRRRGDLEDQIFHYPESTESTEEAPLGSLEFFLLERYRLFSQSRNGSIYQGMVHHKPYQFQHIAQSVQPTRLFSLCGFEEPNQPPVSSIVSKSVSVKIHPLARA